MVLVAKESSQIERARKKIEKRLQEQNSMITPDSLRESANVIRGMIERHKDERIPLHDKNIALFDANHSSASIKSKYIIHLISQLQSGVPLKKAPKKKSSLKGRIK